jgi:hypothetical protein
MTHGEVESSVIEWFEGKDYYVSNPQTNGLQALVDIFATKKGSKSWVVEVKTGDPHIYSAFGQLIAQANDLSHQYKYAVAVPSPDAKPSIRVALEKFAPTDPQIWKMLNLHFLLVGKDKSVTVVRPNSVQKFLISCVRDKWGWNK